MHHSDGLCTLVLYTLGAELASLTYPRYGRTKSPCSSSSECDMTLQDATSMTLSVGPSEAATPTPAPEKPTLEIWAGTPDHQKPAPVPGQTPSGEEPVTPAAKAKQGTSVKRHATPATTPEAVADGLTSLASAKAEAVSAPLPVYPYQAKDYHITGDGVCVMRVDAASGR